MDLREAASYQQVLLPNKAGLSVKFWEPFWGQELSLLALENIKLLELEEQVPLQTTLLIIPRNLNPRCSKSSGLPQVTSLVAAKIDSKILIHPNSEPAMSNSETTIMPRLCISAMDFSTNKPLMQAQTTTRGSGQTQEVNPQPTTIAMVPRALLLYNHCVISVQIHHVELYRAFGLRQHQTTSR